MSKEPKILIADWNDACYNAQENYTVDPHEHIARLVVIGDKLAALAAHAPVEPLSQSEALFAFGGWLTVRDGSLTLGDTHDAAPMAQLVGQFCDAYGFAPPREGWSDHVRKMPCTDAADAARGTR
jgi:hypothetical protein